MIKLGAHLSSHRTGYTHHGIYVGAGKVVHYSGLADGLSKGGICETTIEEFSVNRAEITVITHTNPYVQFTPIEIVKRARDRIGENNYNIIFNNCEHFATWCATGAASSKQVQSTVKIACAGYQTYRAYQMHVASQAFRGQMMKATAELLGNPGMQRTVATLSNKAINAGGSTVLKSLSTGSRVTAMATAGVSGAGAISSGALVSITGASTLVAAPAVLAVGGAALVSYGAFKLLGLFTD